jgi:hypothetical protein
MVDAIMKTDNTRKVMDRRAFFLNLILGMGVDSQSIGLAT